MYSFCHNLKDVQLLLSYLHILYLVVTNDQIESHSRDMIDTHIKVVYFS